MNQYTGKGHMVNGDNITYQQAASCGMSESSTNENMKK